MNQLPGLILVIKSDHVAIMHVFQGRKLYIRKVGFNSNPANIMWSNQWCSFKSQDYKKSTKFVKQL